ncbi:hypothetical protein Hden_0883 [Hyphomicrobium denitrificans ATCC 51888]|uniref:Uncharacterized protein n=1 Tax=Hyphomicrobium denitrificans (strain ATCC 51888 / DSM 1869 / NCIMB 11706 / TK 0415) TaxID=582899 RepID=D8JUB0_HYPDA|nr:hypothetical protein [Hyphomicrobium denitrificans]ADJ22700.1 hypothetical protein Hden_0883 [Hyphomicrobium denitrificans ATCC 51888]
MLGGRAERADRGAVIVTVHGTNDAAPEDDGGRWWQKGSPFTERLVGELAQRGIAGAEIVPMHWSGANSDYDRLTGSANLARLLHRLDKDGRPHAVIAHSHGGNVTQEALAQTSRAGRRGGVVSFGTPFFTRRLKAVPLAIALFQIVMGAVVAPIMVWYLISILGEGTDKIIETIVVFGGLLALSLWSFVAGVRKIFHRAFAMRRFAKSMSPKDWLVIHSPRDEAMRLLEQAAVLSPHYVKTEAAVRALTAFAALAGVVVTTAVFLLYGGYFLRPIIDKISAGEFGLGMAADFTFLLLVPVVYGAVFLLIAGLARAGGGWLYAKVLSSAIHGGVLGAAFGDDGRFKLTGIRRLPPYLSEAKEQRIDALSFGGVDDAAVFVAAQKLYDSIVAAEGPEGGITDADTMWKRLSDALYHNAYMRDDGVIAVVADHLVDAWGRKGAVREINP